MLQGGIFAYGVPMSAIEGVCEGSYWQPMQAWRLYVPFNLMHTIDLPFNANKLMNFISQNSELKFCFASLFCNDLQSSSWILNSLRYCGYRSVFSKSADNVWTEKHCLRCEVCRSGQEAWMVSFSKSCNSFVQYSGTVLLRFRSTVHWWWWWFCGWCGKCLRFLRINPEGRVPVIKINGDYIPDSDIIVDVLEKSYPYPPLSTCRNITCRCTPQHLCSP